MRVKLVLMALAVSVAGAGSAVAQTAVPDRLAYLSEGKAVFERSCGVCHGLERPLSKTFDKAGWERTVERMHDNGAEVNAAERAQVVAYLLAKNTFEAKCSACHGTDRPLGKSKSAADWLATVQRMSGKKPGHLNEAEVADITAYLAVARPQP
jgi:mono/diheme cytochrome c family protein